MPYQPISNTVPQYAASGSGLANAYYLKGYEAGTTTPLSMGTDATPTSTLAKCKLNSSGYPISNSSDETTVFIPYFNADYKLVLYSSETDADNNTFANAVWVVDNIGIDDTTGVYAATVAVMKTLALAVGDTVETGGYTSVGDGGHAEYSVVAGGTGTDDGGSYIDLDNGRQAKLLPKDVVYADQFGCTGDGVADDQAKLQNAIDYAESISTNVVLDPAKTYAIGSALTVGATGQEIFIQGGGRKNSSTLKALSAFTGGMVILAQGGVRHMNFTGFDKDTSGHSAIYIGTGSSTNPPVTIDDVLNNGGFYDFIKTIYEFDRSVITRVTSEVALGHAVMDLQTGGSYSHTAGATISKCSLRNPDESPSVSEATKYGIIYGRTESLHLEGVVSNFDYCVYSAGSNRNTDINNLVVLDLRSTVSNNLWEDEWAATTAYSLNDYIKPTNTNINGHFYICTTAGTSGGSEPTWPTTAAGTVADGTVVWTEVGVSVGLYIGADQQTSITDSRFENGIVGMQNASNANIYAKSSRFVGEPASILSNSGSNSEMVMDNCLVAGDFHLSAGGGTMRFVGRNNLISSDTIGDVPDHEANAYYGTNVTFSSGGGIDYSATSAAGATTQVLDDYAEGTWTPTVTANSNCSSPAISTAAYTKIGNFVWCEIEGTVTVTATSTDTDFKFTLPFNMRNGSTSAPNGMIYISWGGYGMAAIVDWSGANSTEVGLVVPATFVGATGSQSFSGAFGYHSV